MNPISYHPFGHVCLPRPFASLATESDCKRISGL
jgi:hypothetical protein